MQITLENWILVLGYVIQPEFKHKAWVKLQEVTSAPELYLNTNASHLLTYENYIQLLQDVDVLNDDDNIDSEAYNLDEVSDPEEYEKKFAARLAREEDMFDNTLKKEARLENFCANPAAGRVLKRIFKLNPDSVNWLGISKNPSRETIQMLRDNVAKICWSNLCTYNTAPEAFDLFKKFGPEDLGSIAYFGANPNQEVVDMVLDNQMISTALFCQNSNPKVLPIIDELMAKAETWSPTTWANCRAINIIKKYKNIQPHYLSCNPHPEAIGMLLKNPDRIQWSSMAENPSMFEPDNKAWARVLVMNAMTVAAVAAGGMVRDHLCDRTRRVTL
jgi:hypothetical protein